MPIIEHIPDSRRSYSAATEAHFRSPTAFEMSNHPPIMNIKRLLLAIAAAFVVIFVTDFLIHGIWMMSDYRATQQLWRSDSEMQARIA